MVFLLFRVEQIPEGMSQRRHGHRASQKGKRRGDLSKKVLVFFLRGPRAFLSGEDRLWQAIQTTIRVFVQRHEKEERKSVMTP
jgi:hypothetical protein